MSSVDHLESLGSGNTAYRYDEPSPNILETFDAPEPGQLIVIDFPEFTSLCPKTGQPDFANIHIDYRPNLKAVESKSLKLYFFAYRQYGSFMESIVCKIKDDLVKVLDPEYLLVRGDFHPRGAMTLVPISVYERE